MTASFKKYFLNFKLPSGTSRGVLKTKETYFIIIKNENKMGIGECGLFKGLSIDDCPDYEEKLQWVCKHIDLGFQDLCSRLKMFPSIQIGLETAFKSLSAKNLFEIYPSNFSSGDEHIPINGLVWM
ncbi:MAG: o-succinylbenzoate synthase, partial [Flavobacteriaceae bacterium]|nr:o-succinylbenzoate synthase [Flavobacteriaceae bacterium]